MATTAWTTRLTGPAIAIAAIVGFVALSRPAPAQHLEAEEVDIVFGDPFTLEWQSLASADTREDGLIPMVSSDERCVGFARTDWLGNGRHPSVARCRADLENSAGVLGVRTIATGPDTWRFLFFDRPVRSVELDADGQQLGVEWRGGVAAAVTATSVGELTLRWTDDTGQRFVADLAGASP